VNDRRVNVTDIIDAAPISGFQLRILVLCLLVSMLDGFDTQSIAFVAASITDGWHLTHSQFGSIFSATLLGTALGAVLLGHLADRFGRRLLLTIAVTLFGSMTLACSFSHSFYSLLAFRLLAGIGLGGAIPNFIAFASEYSPRRVRSTVVVVTLWGFPIGAILGGLISTAVIQHFGWSAVFLIGGVLPLMLAPVLFVSLPESIRFLTLRPASAAAVARILKRIAPTLEYDARIEFVLGEAPVNASRISSVLKGRLAAGTALLGGALCMSLLLAYLLVNWIPLLFRQLGLPLADAVFGTVLLNLSGIAGSYLLAHRLDLGRHALTAMMVGYLVAALAVASIGAFGTSRGFMMASTACVGFFLIGTQLSLTAYTANFFPTAVRATGVGLTQAMGRFGSLLGPLLAGWLLSSGISVQHLFKVASIPALLAAAALFTFHLMNSRGARPAM
jgi:AAHS family 4-hydroxybenzoate transporter-like MFS transporter